MMSTVCVTDCGKKSKRRRGVFVMKERKEENSILNAKNRCIKLDILATF